jgi:hypothetical protein
MNALFAAPLGIAAALVGTAADATVQTRPVPEPEPVVPPAAELPAEPSAPAPARDVLDPEPLEAAAAGGAADPAKICDEKCKFVELTKTILPDTGVADLVSVALQPQEHSLSTPTEDGMPAVTLKIDPTKIARGKGLVVKAVF